MWRQMAGYRVPVFASVFIGLVRIVASLLFIWISKEMIDAAVNDNTILGSDETIKLDGNVTISVQYL